MVRWICNVKLDGKISVEELKYRIAWENVWRIEDYVIASKQKIIFWSSECRTLSICVIFSQRWLWKTWNEVLRSYLKERKVSKDLAKNRNAWKSLIRNPCKHENRCWDKYDDDRAFSVYSDYMQSSALFQNIFKFCIFLPKFSNILPFLALFNIFFALFWSFYRKIVCTPLLSRIGPGWWWCILMYNQLVALVLLRFYVPLLIRIS